MYNKKVLVSYAWVRSSWAMIRNLAQNGLTVYAADKQRVFMSRYSRYCAGCLQYPDYQEDEAGFIAALRDFILAENIGTYIPSHEEGFVVARHLDSFPGFVKIPVSDYDKIDILHHKGKAQELAEKLGIPHPRSYCLSGEDALYGRLAEMPEKGVLKKVYGHGAHGIVFYTGHGELEAIWRQRTHSLNGHYQPTLIQEFIPGKIRAVTVLAKEGMVLAHCARRNIREKQAFGGACVKCESIDFEAGLEVAKRMIREVGFTGVAMFEFLVDPSNEHRFWLMEVNPRYWGTLAHDIDSGVPYPYLHFCLANDLPFPHMPPYRRGFISRWIVGDFIHYLQERRRGQGNAWSRLRKHFDFDDHSLMDFKLDDPLPFFVQSYLYYKHRREVLR